MEFWSLTKICADVSRADVNSLKASRTTGRSRLNGRGETIKLREILK